MIVSLHPQHVSFPRTSGSQICGTVIPWSTFPTSALHHPKWEKQDQGPGKYLGLHSREVVWLFFLVLPTASSFRLSLQASLGYPPLLFKGSSILPTSRKGKLDTEQDWGSTQQTWWGPPSSASAAHPDSDHMA